MKQNFCQKFSLISKIKKFSPKSLSYFVIVLIFLISSLVIGILIIWLRAEESSKNLYHLSLEALSNKEYGKGYYYITKAIEKDPNNTEYYIVQVTILREKGRFSDALEVLNKALSYKVDRVRIYEILCATYKDLEDFNKYSGCLEDLISYSEREKDIKEILNYRYDLFRAYLKVGKIEEARLQLESIISSDSLESKQFYLAARDLALWNIDNESKRNSFLSIAEQSNDENIKKDVEEIKNFIKKAEDAKKSSDFAQYYGWLASAQLTYNLCPISHDLFKKSIENGDRFGIYRDAHKYFGICLYKEGLYDDALKEIETAIKADPIDLELWIYKANICRSKGDYTCADAAYEKLVTVGIENSSWYENYCDYLSLRNRVEEAFSCFDKLYELAEPPNKTLIAEDAIVYGFENDANLEFFEKWLGRLDQSSFYFFDVKGWIFLQKGDIKTAEESFNQAFLMDKYNPWLSFHFALLYKAKGDDEKALENGSKAIDYDTKGEVSPKAIEFLKSLKAIV